MQEAAATKSRPQPYPLARSAPVSSKSPAGAALRKTETKKTGEEEGGGWEGVC